MRSFVLHEGVRFPLGVASAGLAILAALPDSEVDELLARKLTGRHGDQHSAANIRRQVALTRAAGYSVNPGLVLEGSWGMGAAVLDRAGRPEWALSLTGIEPRFRSERQSFLGPLLREQAELLGAALRAR